MAFSKAFDKSEQSSVSLKGRVSGSFASTVSMICDCFALAAKADKIRLTVSFSQKRKGVMASMSDWAVRRYSLISLYVSLGGQTLQKSKMVAHIVPIGCGILL
jgi:hypothetical protein